MTKRRGFERNYQCRKLRRVFFLSCEGRVTEREYFNIVKAMSDDCRINCICSNGKTVLDVKVILEKKLKQYPLKKQDQAWLVVDRDHWPEEHLKQLYQWASGRSNHGLALSNPMFEYWLLLHFEEAKGVDSKRVCMQRLRKHIPDYNKHVEERRIDGKDVKKAIKRARAKDNPPCKDWPRKPGSTVYRLIEEILKNSTGN